MIFSPKCETNLRSGNVIGVRIWIWMPEKHDVGAIVPRISCLSKQINEEN